MASDKGPIVTEAPPLTSALQAPTPLPVAPEPDTNDAAARANPLKRTREAASTSPKSPTAQLTSKTARFSLRTTSPAPLTAAAALEENRRRREVDRARYHQGSSENPARSVLAALAKSAAPMSRVEDAPSAPAAPMGEVTKVVPAVSISTDAIPNAEGSPKSVASGGSLDDAQVTESPTAMDVDSKADGEARREASLEEKTPGSLSYPGPMHTGGLMPAPPNRTMSYPMPSSGQTSPTTLAPRKHKCPYCDTEFTRHHNLKSHLLTHSQEKPYVCQQCDMRFRRLHDLKRHSKLHTGEKPHICPKCDRKFARGDALARHSKGAGGCAGRRSSMGSFADGDDIGGVITEGDDSTMSGISYANEEAMAEDDRRRSLPSIKAQHVAGAAQPGSQTYPPVVSRLGSGGLYPPIQDRGTSSTNTSPSMPTSTASGHTPNTSISSMPMSAGSGGSVYSQGMTESPKPLSPGGGHGQPGQDPNIARQRSPSLTQQFQQQQFARRQSDRRTPPSLSLPPSQGPKLPAISGIAPPRGSQAQKGHASNGDASNNMFSSDSGLWTYVQQQETRIIQLEKLDQDKQTMISSLTSELAAVKAQLAAMVAAADSIPATSK